MNSTDHHTTTVSEAKPAYYRSKILQIIVISGVLFLGSCSSNSTSSGGSGNNQNMDQGSTNPTFTNVKQIFSGSCAVSGCHDSSTKQNGVDLSSYDAAINSVGDQYGKKVIQAEDAANSPLFDKISSDNPEYGVRMPKGRSSLSSDDINLIKQWINDGAKNN